MREYILDRYPQDAIDPMDHSNDAKVRHWGPFVFVGLASTPLAIELSQYGYECYVAVLDSNAKKQVERDANRQAGLFKRVVVGDYFPGPVIEGSKLFVIDTLNEVPENGKVIDLLKMWLRNHQEVVCALPRDRDWRSLLSGDFRIYQIGITNDDIFLSITNK